MTHADLTAVQRGLLLEVMRGSGASSAAVAAAMGRYLEELYDGNGRFGLIAKDDAADRDRLFIRHILDSIVPWTIIARAADEAGRRRLYDLGSGAGLPGLPLAAVLSGLLDEVVLVERRTKRVAFLRGVVPLVRSAFAGTDPTGPTDVPAAMTNVRVSDADADNLAAREGHHLADAVVVFRAFKQTTEETLASLARTFPPGTPVCVYKGRTEQTMEEARLIGRSSWAMDGEENGPHVHPIVVPSLDAERCVLTWKTQRSA